MSALTIITRAKTTTGRYDISEADWLQLLNDAQQFLEGYIVPNVHVSKIYTASAEASEVEISHPQEILRAFYKSTEDPDSLYAELELFVQAEFEMLYPDTPGEGTPSQATVAASTTSGVTTWTLKLNAAPAEAFSIKLVGNFYEPSLTTTASVNLWTENYSAALLQTCIYLLECQRRNTEGQRDALAALIPFVNSIQYNLTNKQFTGYAEMGL
jgi:hypothetical protein